MGITTLCYETTDASGNQTEVCFDIEVLDTKSLIITTEKDYMRLKQFDEILKVGLSYIPIHFEIINDEEQFLDLIRFNPRLATHSRPNRR